LMTRLRNGRPGKGRLKLSAIPFSTRWWSETQRCAETKFVGGPAAAWLHLEDVEGLTGGRNEG